MLDFEVVLSRESKVLAILMGAGAKGFHPYKWEGARKLYPVFGGGGGGESRGGTKSWTRDIPIL